MFPVSHQPSVCRGMVIHASHMQIVVVRLGSRPCEGIKAFGGGWLPLLCQLCSVTPPPPPLCRPLLLCSPPPTPPYSLPLVSLDSGVCRLLSEEVVEGRLRQRPIKGVFCTSLRICMRIIILFFLFVLRFRLYIYPGWVRRPNLTLFFSSFFLNNIFWLCSKAARLCMLTEPKKRRNTSSGKVCSSAINTITPMHTFWQILQIVHKRVVWPPLLVLERLSNFPNGRFLRGDAVFAGKRCYLIGRSAAGFVFFLSSRMLKPFKLQVQAGPPADI